jgi:hypothetical protein
MQFFKNKAIDTALQLGVMQFFNWGICTISWRSVAQANYGASIITDSALASLTFFVIRKMVKDQDENSFVQWFGYTLGGVCGTLAGIKISLLWLGK